MRLFGSYTSPFVRHCRIALIQSELSWEFVEVDAAVSAEKSPTRKVPFLQDGDIKLTDSGSIVKYIREQSGRSFPESVMDYELFCMSNTVLDASLNLFLLHNDDLGPDQSTYLGRQTQRVASGLDELNRIAGQEEIVLTDGILRLACLLEWGLFRNRFDLGNRKNLLHVIQVANEDSSFKSTAIPT